MQNPETDEAIIDLLQALKKLHAQGYFLYASDAVYLVGDGQTIELAQSPSGGTGVRITGYWVHHHE